MPPKKLDACIFCMGECECKKPVKKPPRKGGKTGGEGVSTPPSLPVQPDFKAAMKAARKSPEVKPEPVVETLEDPEFVETINNLFPILHPTEHRRYADIFNRPELRAIRWKRRHGSLS